ncbi:MAG TPA: 3-oxoacyl-ACP synthase, partial [Chloroflexia bacterium]|nr:3-oxoacyl-ACP synthase [Chloroflexia bacterium]
MVAKYAAITGWGSAVPGRVLTNADLEKIVDTTDEWITTRTGIKERHIVAESESTATLAVTASRRALERANVSP